MARYHFGAVVWARTFAWYRRRYAYRLQLTITRWEAD
jgi:hypothetical protein